MADHGSISRDGDFFVIRGPMSDLHTLRVCLHPCPCVTPKSNATLDYAKRLDRGLARLEVRNG